mmetsp:Transcript_6360/g.15331  ORF Transcript_6360/g.15331 Transcript_6360/m.15331 type:complete len:226 (-) Transcript_6360:327-1004(-)
MKCCKRPISRCACAILRCSVLYASCNPDTSRRRLLSSSSAALRESPCAVCSRQNLRMSSVTATCSLLRTCFPTRSKLRLRLRTNLAKRSLKLCKRSSFLHMSVSKSPILAPCSLQKSVSFSLATLRVEHFSRHLISDASRKSILSFALASSSSVPRSFSVRLSRSFLVSSSSSWRSRCCSSSSSSLSRKRSSVAMLSASSSSSSSAAASSFNLVSLSCLTMPARS